MATPRIGSLRPVYSLVLNPHSQTKLSTCPDCGKPTHPRKFALLLCIVGWGFMAQGKMCKYCAKCKMILVQQDDLELQLALSCQERAPQGLGKEYVIVGVVEIGAFKRSLDQPMPMQEMLEHTSDLKKQLGLGLQLGGWYPAGKEPPILPARREQRIPERAAGAI